MGKRKTRASNGMGSVRQRADGRWEGRYTAPDGQQKSVYGKTEKEVTAKLRGAMHTIDVGAWREPSKMTVADWLCIWLTDYQGRNAPLTLKSYRVVVEKWFVPVIGEIKLTKLLPMHIRRLMNSMGSLSHTSVRTYIRILSTALERAIEAGLITTNPCKGVAYPRAQAPTMHIIDREDIPAFLAAVNGTKYANELTLMLFTGLRAGEMRGLRWSDVDFDAGTINIQRQLHPKINGKRTFASPKYGEARLLHVPDEVMAILRDQKRKQAEQRLAFGGWEDDDFNRDLVFRQKDGKAHTPETIRRTLTNVGKVIGQPDLHPHDLRHSYAVAALRSGADVKTVQHNLGHKSSNMTLDVYAAYTEDAGRAGANMLSDYIKNAQK